MSTTPATLISLLAGMRKASGMSQQAVADLMGTTQSAVSDIESGQVEPRLSTLTRYASALGADLEIGVRVVVPLVAVDREPAP